MNTFKKLLRVGPEGGSEDEGSSEDEEEGHD